MVTKRHTTILNGFGTQESDLFSMLSELLCHNGGIIKVPEGVKYTQDDTIAVISYAATSTANSVEAAVKELKRKMPDAAIPSADTVFNYIYENKIEDILAFFRAINSEFLALTGIPDEPVDVAVDFHDKGYYGDKNDQGVRGIKPKNGTSWGYSYLTIDMLSEQKLTEVDFIMAAKNNKRIKRMLEVHKRKNGVTPVIFKYQFKDTSSPEFYLVAIPNPDYDPEDTKNKNEFRLFATSIIFGSVDEFVKRVPKEYKRRWNIETGYRVKNEFKIRTCSKEGVARVLFFAIQCIMHNFLNVQKSILSITAYELKSLISQDIQKFFVEGKSLNSLPLRVFYTKIATYNEHRITELCSKLAES